MPSTTKSIAVTLGVAFSGVGLLVGTLVAFSAQSLVQAVIAALFAAFGGSVIVLLEKLQEPTQAKAGVAIGALAWSAFVGVYAGVFVNEHQFLTPPAGRNSKATVPPEARKYLRENLLPQSEAIDTKFRGKLISGEEAYGQLRALISKD